jgi:hypothetical protein
VANYSQNWRHTRYESSKTQKQKAESLYILGYLLELIIKIWLFGKKIPSKFCEFGPFSNAKSF